MPKPADRRYFRKMLASNRDALLASGAASCGTHVDARLASGEPKSEPKKAKPFKGVPLGTSVADSALLKLDAVCEAMSGKWIGMEGETYTIKKIDGELTWHCVRDNCRKQKRRFAIIYKLGSSRVYWTDKGRYFLEVSDLLENPGQIRWFYDGGTHSKTRFRWHRRAPASVESDGDHEGQLSIRACSSTGSCVPTCDARSSDECAAPGCDGAVEAWSLYSESSSPDSSFSSTACMADVERNDEPDVLADALTASFTCRFSRCRTTHRPRLRRMASWKEGTTSRPPRVPAAPKAHAEEAEATEPAGESNAMNLTSAERYELLLKTVGNEDSFFSKVCCRSQDVEAENTTDESCEGSDVASALPSVAGASSVETRADSVASEPTKKDIFLNGITLDKDQARGPLQDSVEAKAWAACIALEGKSETSLGMRFPMWEQNGLLEFQILTCVAVSSVRNYQLICASQAAAQVLLTLGCPPLNVVLYGSLSLARALWTDNGLRPRQCDIGKSYATNVSDVDIAIFSRQEGSAPDIVSSFLQHAIDIGWSHVSVRAVPRFAVTQWTLINDEGVHFDLTSISDEMKFLEFKARQAGFQHVFYHVRNTFQLVHGLLGVLSFDAYIYLTKAFAAYVQGGSANEAPQYRSSAITSFQAVCLGLYAVQRLRQPASSLVLFERYLRFLVQLFCEAKAKRPGAYGKHALDLCRYGPQYLKKANSGANAPPPRVELYLGEVERNLRQPRHAWHNMLHSTDGEKIRWAAQGALDKWFCESDAPSTWNRIAKDLLPLMCTPTPRSGRTSNS